MDSFEAINELEPLYFANLHNLDTEIFEPICKVATSVRCMSGYFSSGFLAELSKSLSYFLSTREASIKFIISPNLSHDDTKAIYEAVQTDKNLVPLLFPNFETTEDNLRTRAIEALAYLVATRKLVFKLALQKSGLFHPKCWLFETENGLIAVHGSANATGSGFSVNTEQIGIDKEWDDGKSKRVIQTISEMFDAIWNDTAPDIDTLPANTATLSFLQQLISNRSPDESEWENIQKRLLEAMNDAAEPSGDQDTRKLRVPDWLDYTSGPYAHQGEAISAWIESGRGILSIATGGGKTLTSLVAATLASESEDSLMIVVAVPTKALLNQWADDIENFSLTPLNVLGMPSSKIKRELRAKLRNLRLKSSVNEVLICTHETLKSDVIDILEDASERVPIMLIGDEVHNLGSQGFQSSAKECFKYRLGLSATAERQFDDEGTRFLFDYFGDVVYDFPLERAIGNCLVPYRYFVHTVTLDEYEEEEWGDLTYQIRQLTYAIDLPDSAPEKERWKLLCLQRRRIVESANAKLISLAESLPKSPKEIQRTLIFCTDKDPEQLEQVNELLTRLSVNFHQVTADETSSKILLQKVIDSFSDGDLQALTSKRVLDEGFNVPQTETAFFLASNTVRRQWIQRLGRVLRLSPRTNKRIATVHDFVVVPTINDGQIDPDLKGLIKGEYERVSFFSKLSDNGLGAEGSTQLMSELIELMENK